MSVFEFCDRHFVGVCILIVLLAAIAHDTMVHYLQLRKKPRAIDPPTHT